MKSSAIYRKRGLARNPEAGSSVLDISAFQTITIVSIVSAPQFAVFNEFGSLFEE